MYHRMYLRRCSMSSISEESETSDEHPSMNSNGQTTVDHCLGDLHSFKKEIREAYQDLSTLERQARWKTTAINDDRQEEDDLDFLLEQLHTLEQRLDEKRTFRRRTNASHKRSVSAAISAQFDELDQALATLTNTINNVEIELADSGNSSASSAVSDSTRVTRHTDGDEHSSDSGLSQSTDSISLPLMPQQLSNASSVFSCDTLKTSASTENPIRLALEKMHEANIKKLFVKIHTDDQSTKNVLIDETMSIHQMLILLLHKYHLRPTLNYAVVEDLPELHLCRVLEDHQNLINDGLIYWPRDTRNRIRFQEVKNRYTMFDDPKNFFSFRDDPNEKLMTECLTDYIASNTIVLPDDITSVLYVKDKTRKVWKKYTCILRQSGIYQIPKATASKRDLVCLLKFDTNMQLYFASDWLETLRSPTQYGFALKYAHVQKKSTKYIHYLCTHTSDACQRWVDGIRMILYGEQLYKNYQQMKEIVNGGLEKLATRLPEQRHFNFIQSTTSSMHESLSSISLPINQIVFDSVDTPKALVDLDCSSAKQVFYSLDRQKKSKTPFTRSSSFHSNLHQSKAEAKQFRTKSISPKKGNDPVLYRSKSTKEISSRPSSASRAKSNTNKKDPSSTEKSSSASFIPFIHQCLQSDQTPVHFKPPKRSPPTIPPKTVSSMHNHIYDSLQDIPFPITDDYGTVSPLPLPPTRVTEL